MGIVLIGIFILAAIILLIRGSKLHTGKAVPVILCLALLIIQTTQLLGLTIQGYFKFTMAEYLVLSALFAFATMLDFTRKKSWEMGRGRVQRI